MLTGITPSAWAEEGHRAVVTAVDLLEQQQTTTTTGQEVPEGWELL